MKQTRTKKAKPAKGMRVRRSVFAYPYVVWMAIFILAPMLLILYYAFTNDGGATVENIVQAASRDILSFAMQQARCLDIVMHVHDEMVVEVDQHISAKVLCEQMRRTPPWAEGLLLCADGYDCPFYKKD